MIKAIIFDMNGVIVDDEPLHELSFRRVCRDIGIELDHNRYNEWCLGRTDEDGFRNILSAAGQNPDIAPLVGQKGRYYRELLSENIKSHDGVLELIARLFGQYTLALASSAPREEIDIILKHFNIQDKFEVIVSADDVSKGKPDPEPYLMAAAKLKLKPGECLVIEDSGHGIASAKRAGMKCIAVTTTHKAGDLQQADRIVGNFHELGEMKFDL